MNKGEFFSFLKTAFMDVLEQKQKCIQLIKYMMLAVRLSNPTLTALPWRSHAMLVTMQIPLL